MAAALHASFPTIGDIPVRGKLRANADIARNTWFQVGGTAEWLFKPADADDLAVFLSLLPAEVPLTVIGVGSNLLVRDGGVVGVVVRLGRGFTALETLENDEHIHAGAAVLDVHVAQYSAEQGIAGLEFLAGIPGTLGGAVRMNAGAYESDISQVLLSAEIVTRNGERQILSGDEMGFTYRHSALKTHAIVVAATLKGIHGEQEAIAVRIAEIQQAREATQPIRSKTGGSTFKNPDGHKAWQLIDQAGCRGLKIGGAQVSEKHCNFLINTGDATANDIETLGEEVRKRVKEKSGIMLEWEIKRIGRASDADC